MGREGEVVQQLVPQFERTQPGVRVEVQTLPWSAAHEKLLTAFVGKSMPDVFQLGNTWVPELATIGAIAPIDAELAGSTTVAAGDFFPGILDTNVLDGHTYALPWYVDTRLLFYRRDLLAAAGLPVPRSWQEWRAAMERIAGLAPGRYAVLLPLSEWQPLVALALQGGDLLGPELLHGNFRGEAFRRALTFYVDLFRSGLAPSAGEAQLANLYQEFAAGRFAFFISGPWNLGELRRRLPAELQDAWAVAPLPSPNGEAPGTSVAGGASLAIGATSSKRDLAWKLIEFLAGTEPQIELYRLTGDLPARQSAWHAAGLKEDPRAGAFWRQLEHVRSTPKIPEWERIAAKIMQHTESAVRGRSIEETLANLDADVDAILEKRRALVERGGFSPEPMPR
ncbi:MAG TPA: sugar ABC transporter substrate-binding protein [Terriglobales bacterium]|nr:sugar ABC transporter substrate-binding protein [Terriglobales bacterium]